MAAGVVSGAAALMISVEPTLNPATVKARMMRSARKIAGDPTDAGAGVLDVTAALEETGLVTAAPSPRMARSDEGPVLLIEDTGQTWGGSEWGAAFLFSDAFIFSDSFIHAGGYIWSDAFIWSDVFIWSDAAVWADAVDDIQPLMYEDVQGLVLNDD